jgi:hypothetical protein
VRTHQIPPFLVLPLEMNNVLTKSTLVTTLTWNWDRHDRFENLFEFVEKDWFRQNVSVFYAMAENFSPED